MLTNLADAALINDFVERNVAEARRAFLLDGKAATGRREGAKLGHACWQNVP